MLVTPISASTPATGVAVQTPVAMPLPTATAPARAGDVSGDADSATGARVRHPLPMRERFVTTASVASLGGGSKRTL